MTSKQFRVRTLNAISGKGLARFPDDRYEVGGSVEDPHALLPPSSTTPRSPDPCSRWPVPGPAPIIFR